MPNLKLTYFNSPGRAEPVRVALRLAGIPFEDHRLDFPGFGALKAQGAFPLGSVPVLEVDGVAYPQTAAMLRYVARLGGELYPTDALAALVVDSAIDTFNDTLSNALLPSFYERDMDRKLAMRAEFVAGPLPTACRFIEGLLERSGGPFVTGTAMTIADLLIANQILQIQGGHLDGVAPDALTPYPRLLAMVEAYRTDPRVTA